MVTRLLLALVLALTMEYVLVAAHPLPPSVAALLSTLVVASVLTLYAAVRTRHVWS